MPHAKPPQHLGDVQGRSVERAEDESLLMGAGAFVDDLDIIPGTLHAAFVRSPIAHGRILGIDCSKALALPGVVAALTGAELAQSTQPFTAAADLPMRRYALAVDRVRYVGEPVAVVCAESPYVAEDTAAEVDARFGMIRPVVDPLEAMTLEAPVLHDDVGSNIVSDRTFTYGDPRAAFAKADRIVEVSVRYPRNAATPIECHGVVAQYDAGQDAYEVMTNFNGPPDIHAIVASALDVPASRLRFKTPPDLGGSFEHGLFPAIVALCALARKAGRPVKWIEDRVEHLTAATSTTNRISKLRAAIRNDGLILALDWDQIDDCGAYLQATGPATLDRMHGNMTGAYRLAHLTIRNRIVLTNKTPTSLGRGRGGPPVYFALERLTAKIARLVGREHLEVIARNMISSEEFPYRTATGGIYESGNYEAAIELAERADVLPELRFRRDSARADGRLYGVGIAAVVAPSIPNIGLMPAEGETADTTDFGSSHALLSPSEAEGIKSSAAHGLVVDLCGVEVDAVTGQVRIDRYVTIQEGGGILRPGMADGHIRGGFASAVGAALYEQIAYGADGSFLSGTFADYALPTAVEIPDIEIHHIEAPSPVEPVAAEGIGVGNCMSAPVTLANAVADALGLDDIELPLGPSRVLELIGLEEPPPPRPSAAIVTPALTLAGYAIKGEGMVSVAAGPAKVWAALHDRDALGAIVPGCQVLDMTAPGHFQGVAMLGAGMVKGAFATEVEVIDLDTPRALRLIGAARGTLGTSRGEAVVVLTADGDATRIAYRYGVDLSGKVAAVGGRMLRGATRQVIDDFFRRLGARLAPPKATAGPATGREPRGWLRRLIGRDKSAKGSGGGVQS